MTSHTSSAAQLAANRANAQQSTGPKTAAGKTASSQNSRRHGLTSANFVVLAWEAQADYDQLLSDLWDEHQPSTPTEHLLVNSIAKHRWLSDRAAALQELCFDDTRPGQCAEVLLLTYLRYQAHHERALHQSLNALLKLRRERQRENNGFVSQELQVAKGQHHNARQFLQLELLEIRLEQARKKSNTGGRDTPEQPPATSLSKRAPQQPSPA